MPDRFIKLKRVQDEAEKVRLALEGGKLPAAKFTAMYAAYNALLFVLDYGAMPPSEMWKK